MSIFQFFYQRVCQTDSMDERFCLLCQKSLDDENDFSYWLFQDTDVCRSCQHEIKEHKQVYLIDGVEWHILYEYNEFLERIFFQYKEQRDIVLSSLFLKSCSLNKMRKYCVCGLCSSEKKWLERGFDPIGDIFCTKGVFVHSPLYKIKDHKQSQTSKQDRQTINQIIYRKKLYPLDKKPICLVDDVCTTGASLKRASELLKPKIVFVLAAHPLWILEHKENIVEKRKVFW